MQSNIDQFGIIARARLMDNLSHSNIISVRDIPTAVDELSMCLALMNDENRWNYCLSTTMDNIWKLAVLDTLYYAGFCYYSCTKYNRTPCVIIFDPANWGIGTKEERLLKLVTKFFEVYQRLPTAILWPEMRLSVQYVPLYSDTLLNSLFNSATATTATTALNNTSLFANLNTTHRTNTTNSVNLDAYSSSSGSDEEDENIYNIEIRSINNTNISVKLHKEHRFGKLIKIIARKMSVAISNFRLLYNGRQLYFSEHNKELQELFSTNMAPILHYVGQMN